MFKLHHQRFLKVKIKSLAEEARIIRLEEKRTKSDELRNSLHYHRTIEVRAEARAAQIAYAFLRGKKLSEIEATADEHSYVYYLAYRRVPQIVKKFGNRAAERLLESWLQQKPVAA